MSPELLLCMFLEGWASPATPSTLACEGRALRLRPADTAISAAHGLVGEDKQILKANTWTNTLKESFRQIQKASFID